MKAAEIALFAICIQVGIALVVEGGMFSSGEKSIYYESTLTNTNLPNNISALSQTEQDQLGIDIFTTIKDTFTWGWIKQFSQPWYNNDADVKNFIDHFILLMTGVNAIILGAAVIEFLKNQAKVL